MMTKSQHYRWSDPGDIGRSAILRLADLNIDHRYQRDEDANRALVIARDFSWRAFGVVVVMQRDDATYWVVDGQHRVAGARRRGDIDAVPCVVFHSTSVEQEAKAWSELNDRRKNSRAHEKFKNRVMSRDEPEATIDRWANDNGFIVGKASGGNARVIDFPRNIVNLWKLDSEASKRALLSQRDIVSPLPLHSAIHRGTWWLERRGVDTSLYVEKLASIGGKVAILKAIHIYCIEVDKAPSEFTAGVAILRLINHKRKKKIYVDGAIDPYGGIK